MDCIFFSKVFYTSKTGRIISPKPNRFEISNIFPYNEAFGVKIGSIVYVKVIKIKRLVFDRDILGRWNQHVQIHLGNDKKIAYTRENDRPSNIVECFNRNDIVRAKVISIGDSISELVLIDRQ